MNGRNKKKKKKQDNGQFDSIEWRDLMRTFLCVLFLVLNKEKKGESFGRRLIREKEEGDAIMYVRLYIY